MKRYLISYDLRQPHKDYALLHRHLQNDYVSSTRPLASVWIIKSEADHVTVRNTIGRFIDNDDKLLVVDVTGKAAAWLKITREELNF